MTKDNLDDEMRDRNNFFVFVLFLAKSRMMSGLEKRNKW